MGQTASNITNLVTKPYNLYSWVKGGKGQNSGEASSEGLIPRGATLFVYKRQGSMFFDEDGDLAHEFYCEVIDSATNKIVMRRTFKNLVPQGEVELAQPCLHGDLPVILYDSSRLK